MAKIGKTYTEEDDIKEYGGGDFGLVPTGDYEAIIEDSYNDVTKGGKDFICLVFQITDGDFSGRKFWVNLYDHTPGAEAVKASKLKSISEAVGVNFYALEDTVELHDKPMTISVYTKKGTPDYPTDKNEIGSFAALEGKKKAPAKVAKAAKKEEPVEDVDLDDDIPF